MADDKTTKTPEQPVTDSGPGKEMAGVWLIPKAAEKPIDGRTKQGRLLKHE